MLSHPSNATLLLDTLDQVVFVVRSETGWTAAFRNVPLFCVALLNLMSSIVFPYLRHFIGLLSTILWRIQQGLRVGPAGGDLSPIAATTATTVPAFPATLPAAIHCRC